MLRALQNDGFEKGCKGCRVGGAPGSFQAKAEWAWVEEEVSKKARDRTECYDWRKMERKVMHVGGELCLKWRVV